MSKKDIQIDKSKCIGCGLCANTCQQSAIKIINGKAKVVHKDYCDGLGNCLPVCPVNAISFINQNNKVTTTCPSIKAHITNHQAAPDVIQDNTCTHLLQWPIQIQLVPIHASFFDKAHLCIAADCTAFTYAHFHHDFMKNKVTLIGCPKLDNIDYKKKLSQIIKDNNIKSCSIVRMEVPCCSALEKTVIQALKNSGKYIPYSCEIISTNGQII